MTVYKKGSWREVCRESDLVLTLIHGLFGPFAFLTDPAEALDTIPLPAEDALDSARQLIAESSRLRNLVVIDEHGLWEERWGQLVAHPDCNGGRRGSGT